MAIMVFLAALGPYKWCLTCTKVRTLILIQAGRFGFPKIDNNFAFFGLGKTGIWLLNRRSATMDIRNCATVG